MYILELCFHEDCTWDRTGSQIANSGMAKLRAELLGNAVNQPRLLFACLAIEKIKKAIPNKRKPSNHSGPYYLKQDRVLRCLVSNMFNRIVLRCARRLAPNPLHTSPFTLRTVASIAPVRLLLSEGIVRSSGSAFKVAADSVLPLRACAKAADTRCTFV